MITTFSRPFSTTERPHHEASTTRRRRISITLAAATITIGLMAGLFYAFSCAVMLGLHGADDRTFIDVMQRVNVAIQNPVFFLSFFGGLLLPLVAVAMMRGTGSKDVARWTLGALGLYVVVLLVTSGVSIPLNDELAKAGNPSLITDPAAVRDRFETAWDVWNVVRAVACTAALGCLTRALLLHGRSVGSHR